MHIPTAYNLQKGSASSKCRCDAGRKQRRRDISRDDDRPMWESCEDLSTAPSANTETLRMNAVEEQSLDAHRGAHDRGFILFFFFFFFFFL